MAAALSGFSTGVAFSVPEIILDPESMAFRYADLICSEEAVLPFFTAVSCGAVKDDKGRALLFIRRKGFFRIMNFYESKLQ